MYNFNSIKVRLELGNLPKSAFWEAHFNSIKVRLEQNGKRLVRGTEVISIP